MFKKRETVTQNIAYMALMASINVIFVLLTYFVPFLIFLLVFILPFTSVVVTLYCQKKYLPIYLLATIGLCLIISMHNISDTLFYVIPALLSGTLFGLMVERKIPSVWIIFVSTLLTTALSYAFVPLIEFIYQQNIIEVFLKVFRVDDFQYIGYIVPCFIFLISLIQSVLSYAFIKAELPKLGFEVNEDPKQWMILLGGLISIILTTIFIFAYPTLTYFFSLWIIYFACHSFVELILSGKTLNYLLLGGSAIIGFVLFGVLYSSIDKPFGFLLIDVFFILIICDGIVANYFKTNSDNVE